MAGSVAFALAVSVVGMLTVRFVPFAGLVITLVGGVPGATVTLTPGEEPETDALSIATAVSTTGPVEDGVQFTEYGKLLSDPIRVDPAKKRTFVIVNPAAGVTFALIVWSVLTGIDTFVSGAAIATVGALAAMVVKLENALVLTLPASSVAKAYTVYRPSDGGVYVTE